MSYRYRLVDSRSSSAAGLWELEAERAHERDSGASCICPKNEGLANPGASRTEENCPVRRCSVGHLDPGRPSGI
jgi:hypothetical protein